MSDEIVIMVYVSDLLAWQLNEIIPTVTASPSNKFKLMIVSARE
jgi:hypothetical protein